MVTRSRWGKADRQRASRVSNSICLAIQRSTRFAAHDRTTDALRVLVISRRALARSPQYAILQGLSAALQLIELASTEAAAAALDAGVFDVTLLMVTGTTETAITSLREVCRIAPQVPVLALEISPTRQNAMQLLRNGAGGYVGSDAMTTELGTAIYSVLHRHRYIS